MRRFLLNLLVVASVTSSGCSLVSNDTSLPVGAAPVVDDSELSEQQAELSVRAGESAEQQGKLETAIQCYEQARKRNPELGDLDRRLAHLYDQIGNDNLAEDSYQRALSDKPRDVEVINDFGVFHLHRGNGELAEKLFRRALESDAGHERATNNLAIALAMQDRMAESLSVFESAVGAAAAHSNLGAILARMGRVAEARTQLQRALELDASIRPAAELLSQLNDEPHEVTTASIESSPGPAQQEPPGEGR